MDAFSVMQETKYKPVRLEETLKDWRILWPFAGEYHII